MKINNCFIAKVLVIWCILSISLSCQEGQDSYVDYYMVELDLYVRITRTNPKYSYYNHRVFFSKSVEDLPTTESIVCILSKYDYIEENVQFGRDREDYFWIIKKGVGNDTLLFHPQPNVGIEFQSGSFPTRLAFDKEYSDISLLFIDNPIAFNELYFGFFLSTYQGHLFLKSMGELTIKEIDRNNL